jgi:4-diphosphocytidyl-2-C-methyl-D-erythritol kinase
MTGSGSCVFAICESDEAACVVAKNAEDSKKWWSCATRTVGEGFQFC